MAILITLSTYSRKNSPILSSFPSSQPNAHFIPLNPLFWKSTITSFPPSSTKVKLIYILLDLSAAFDTDDHSILLSWLKNGFEDSCLSRLSWFSSYLCSRKQAVTLKYAVPTSYSIISSGVPQESAFHSLYKTPRSMHECMHACMNACMNACMHACITCMKKFFEISSV